MSAGGIILVCGLMVIGLLKWFIADMTHYQKWGLRRGELKTEGCWAELNKHFEIALRSRRPMLQLFRAVVLPGLLEAEYALHLLDQGELEKALGWTDRALRKSAWKRSAFCVVLRAQALILDRVGRYAEAKTAVAKARSLSPDASEAAMVEGLVEYHLGHLETSLELARQAITGQRTKDGARALASGVLTLQGRFKQALDALVYQPGNVTAFLSPDQLEMMASREITREQVLAMDQELAAVNRPAPHLGAAWVWLELNDIENMGGALDRAERELQSHPVIKSMYLRSRAVWWAASGDALKTEENLAQARGLAKEMPSRSAQYETHQAAGRAYLLLRQSEKAFLEFRSASQLSLHPTEKHTTNYWLARTAETAGESQEATRFFGEVAADGIKTWMSRDAQARLNPGKAERPG